MVKCQKKFRFLLGNNLFSEKYLVPFILITTECKNNISGSCDVYSHYRMFAFQLFLFSFSIEMLKTTMSVAESSVTSKVEII